MCPHGPPSLPASQPPKTAGRHYLHSPAIHAHFVASCLPACLPDGFLPGPRGQRQQSSTVQELTTQASLFCEASACIFFLTFLLHLSRKAGSVEETKWNSEFLTVNEGRLHAPFYSCVLPSLHFIQTVLSDACGKGSPRLRQRTCSCGKCISFPQRGREQ